MSEATIEMLFKWGPIAILVVIFLVGFIIGVIRGSYKVLRRFIYVVLFIVLTWVFMIPITRSIINVNVNVGGFTSGKEFIVDFMESNEQINKFFSYSPGLKETVLQYPEIIVSPILFMVLTLVGLPLLFPIYWIYLLIYNFFAKVVFKRKKYEVNEEGVILRNEKGKKIKIKRKKHRLLGGFIRGAQSVAVFCIILLPVNFINRIYNNVKKVVVSEKGETVCGSIEATSEYNEICKYIEMYDDTLFAKIGGDKSIDKFINDHMTTVEIDGVEVNLEDELSNVAITVALIADSGVIELFKDGNFDINTVDFSKIDFDKLSKAIDYLFKSSTLAKISEAGVGYVLNEIINDKLVDLLKDNDIVSKLMYENASEIRDEIKSVISLFKFAVEKNLVDTIIDNKDNAINIVNKVNEEDIGALLNKILSLRILNKAMPSAIKAYGEEYGINVPETMTSDLNNEVVKNFVNAVKFVKTMELTSLDELSEGNMVDNLVNKLFNEGALKSNTKDSLATLLNDFNKSYLFKDIIGLQLNKLLEERDIKVDARVIKYVDSKEAWLKELGVLEDAYVLYDEYNTDSVINYSRVTNLLNDISGTKIVISVLPFTYDSLLPSVGIEIDSEGLPVIDFEGDNEDSSKVEFYNTWEGELTLLKNIADAAGVLKLQSLDDITVDILDSNDNVDSLATIMGEVYKSNLLKEPFVTFMSDKINDFVKEFEVTFTNEEILSIDTKAKWKNEFSNIKSVLDIDFSDSNNINKENLESVLTSVGNMELFKTKKIDVLRYAIKKSNFLTQAEYDSIVWPNSSDQNEIDAYWANEKSVLLEIADKRDTIETLTSIELSELDTVEIGGILNTTMKSNILKSIVTTKIVDLFVSNGVLDDRDESGVTTNLESSIKSVSDWKMELASIKEMLNIDDSNMNTVEQGESKNKIEKMFDSIETSTLLQNSRANLLLKAVRTINITEVPSTVTVDVLRENSYSKYNNERDIIIEVSKNKNDFDSLGEMTLESLDTSKIGGLLNTVTSSIIFKDYVVGEIKTVFVNNDVLDDRDASGVTTNLENSIKGVSDWKIELASIKDMLNINDTNMNTIEQDESKNKIEKMFDSIETSTLLQNSRANLLLKAVRTINITEVPSNVTVDVLRQNNYAKYTNEKNVIIEVSKNKSDFDSFGTMELKNVDTSKIGGLLDTVTSSIIFKDYVVSEIKKVFVSNDVLDDRDLMGSTTNLENSISSVTSWGSELSAIQNMLNITEENMSSTTEVGGKNAIEKMFDSIETSTLLQNSRANLLLKAVKTINITEVPSTVTVDVLKENNYTKYTNEKNVIIEVSKNKSDFDNLARMELKNVDTSKIGGLLDTVTSSIIFKDYVVGEIKTVFVSNDVLDDRDVSGSTTNLENSISSVTSWGNELSIIQNMLNMDSSSFNTKINNKTNVEIMFDNIESSILLQNSRATLLIKAISTIGLDGVSVPSTVTVATLKDNDYAKYNSEKNVFVTFAENKDAVDNLTDITALNDTNKKSIGALLDAMKNSEILKDKYNATIDTALSGIRSNESLAKYNVTFSTDYSSIVWSSEYDNEGNVTKNGEIDNLLVINNNISIVAGLSGIENVNDDNIRIIGETLDAVDASGLLGEAQANAIANSVIKSLTSNNEATITKQSTDANWQAAFTRTINEYIASVPTI